MIGHGVACLSHGLDGLLKVDSVPEADRRNRQVEAACLPLLFLCYRRIRHPPA